MAAWGSRQSRRLTAAVLLRDEHVCYWCGGYATTADHYPIGRDEGGPDTMGNLVAACGPCNSRRGQAYVTEKHRAGPAPSRRW